MDAWPAWRCPTPAVPGNAPSWTLFPQLHPLTVRNRQDYGITGFEALDTVVGVTEGEPPERVVMTPSATICCHLLDYPCHYFQNGIGRVLGT